MLLARIVALATSAGARLAEPGEFTFRAYLNGRLDLVQAEAVADLVNAVTPLQARAAMDQLEGTLTTAIKQIDAALFDLSARLEASLDFPDEGFHFVTREAAGAEIAQLRRDADARSSRAAASGRRDPRRPAESRWIDRSAECRQSRACSMRSREQARAIVTDVPGT